MILPFLKEQPRPKQELNGISKTELIQTETMYSILGFWPSYKLLSFCQQCAQGKRLSVSVGVTEEDEFVSQEAKSSFNYLQERTIKLFLSNNTKLNDCFVKAIKSSVTILLYLQIKIQALNPLAFSITQKFILTQTTNMSDASAYSSMLFNKSYIKYI